MTDREKRSIQNAKRISAAAKRDYTVLKSLLLLKLDAETLCKRFMQINHGSDWRKLVNAAPVA